jgi:hypothetical protein
MVEETEGAIPTVPEETKPPQGRKTLRTIIIVVVIVLIVGLLGLGIYALVTSPNGTTIIGILRDIFIIVLAFVTIIIGLFLTILIFQLQSLITLLRDEIKPILESANQTARTVRGTTTFVSDAVVTPMITAVSYASAVRQTIKTLAGDSRKKKRSRHAEQKPGEP